jgi:hypothetical protein
MDWLKKIAITVAVLAYALFLAWGATAMFGGTSYPVTRCKDVHWIQGDTTKGAGIKRVSPCVVSDFN